MDDNFTLTNAPPKPVYWRPEKAPKMKQQTLFLGLNDDPGQQELFNPDTAPEVSHPMSDQK